jgi:hypothetical protein
MKVKVSSFEVSKNKFLKFLGKKLSGLLKGLLISKNQGFNVLKFQGINAFRNQGFEVSCNHGFRFSEI